MLEEAEVLDNNQAAEQKAAEPFRIDENLVYSKDYVIQGLRHIPDKDNPMLGKLLIQMHFMDRWACKRASKELKRTVSSSQELDRNTRNDYVIQWRDRCGDLFGDIFRSPLQAKFSYLEHEVNPIRELLAKKDYPAVIDAIQNFLDRNVPEEKAA